jgi:hypothetical protein
MMLLSQPRLDDVDDVVISSLVLLMLLYQPRVGDIIIPASGY